MNKVNNFNKKLITILMIVLSNSIRDFLFSEISLIYIVLAGITIVAVNSVVWVITFRNMSLLQKTLNRYWI